MSITGKFLFPTTTSSSEVQIYFGTTPPTDTDTYKFYFNTDENILYVWNGTKYVKVAKYIDNTNISDLTTYSSSKVQYLFNSLLELLKSYTLYLSFSKGLFEYKIISVNDIKSDYPSNIETNIIKLSKGDSTKVSVDITKLGGSVADKVAFGICPYVSDLTLEYSFDDVNYNSYNNEDLISNDTKSNTLYIKLTNSGENDIYIGGIVVVY